MNITQEGERIHNTYIFHDEYKIVGRGKVVTMSLTKNGLSRKRGELKNFIGEVITYNGNKYKVIGVESHMLGNENYGDQIGLLIKPHEES